MSQPHTSSRHLYIRGAKRKTTTHTSKNQAEQGTPDPKPPENHTHSLMYSRRPSRKRPSGTARDVGDELTHPGSSTTKSPCSPPSSPPSNPCRERQLSPGSQSTLGRQGIRTGQRARRGSWVCSERHHNGQRMGYENFTTQPAQASKNRQNYRKTSHKVQSR